MTEIVYDPEVAERALAFAVQVDALALLLAGEPEEKVAVALETVRDGLEDELTVVVVDLFLQAILRRKVQIERNAMPVQRQ
jgi:hypothetical protein